MKKLSLILCVHLCALILNGCKVDAPDVPICTELTPNKAYCIYTVSKKEQYVDDKNLMNGRTWWDQRNEMLRVPIDSWVKIKEFILKMCKQSNDCGDSIDKTVETINKQFSGGG